VLTLEELLAALRGAGIEWWAVSGRVHLRLPAGSPSAQLAAQEKLEVLRPAVVRWSPALAWLAARRLTPCWCRPMSEAWLDRLGWQDFQLMKEKW
jgi:hypothetical protein